MGISSRAVLAIVIVVSVAAVAPLALAQDTVLLKADMGKAIVVYSGNVLLFKGTNGQKTALNILVAKDDVEKLLSYRCDDYYLVVHVNGIDGYAKIPPQIRAIVSFPTASYLHPTYVSSWLSVPHIGTYAFPIPREALQRVVAAYSVVRILVQMNWMWPTSGQNAKDTYYAVLIDKVWLAPCTDTAVATSASHAVSHGVRLSARLGSGSGLVTWIALGLGIISIVLLVVALLPHHKHHYRHLAMALAVIAPLALGLAAPLLGAQASVVQLSVEKVTRVELVNGTTYVMTDSAVAVFNGSVDLSMVLPNGTSVKLSGVTNATLMKGTVFNVSRKVVATLYPVASEQTLAGAAGTVVARLVITPKERIKSVQVKGPGTFEAKFVDSGDQYARYAIVCVDTQPPSNYHRWFSMGSSCRVFVLPTNGWTYTFAVTGGSHTVYIGISTCAGAWTVTIYDLSGGSSSEHGSIATHTPEPSSAPTSGSSRHLPIKWIAVGVGVIVILILLALLATASHHHRR
ncbi:MAG: hypothetical protein GXO32_05610 [Crenarchaeota archaeon]|nr:hypothetical protein [Thermoproteota archaeon]